MGRQIKAVWAWCLDKKRLYGLPPGTTFSRSPCFTSKQNVISFFQVHKKFGFVCNYTICRAMFLRMVFHPCQCPCDCGTTNWPTWVLHIGLWFERYAPHMWHNEIHIFLCTEALTFISGTYDWVRSLKDWKFNVDTEFMTSIITPAKCIQGCIRLNVLAVFPVSSFGSAGAMQDG